MMNEIGVISSSNFLPSKYISFSNGIENVGSMKLLKYNHLHMLDPEMFLEHQQLDLDLELNSAQNLHLWNSYLKLTPILSIVIEQMKIQKLG